MSNLKKYRKKYDLSKNLTDIINADKWVKLPASLSRCFTCDEISTTKIFKTSLGNICSKCVIEELEDIFNNGKPLNFSLMGLSVKLHGSFVDRFRTLYFLDRREDLTHDIGSESTTEKDTFLRALILNLGYEHPEENPLSRETVRQRTFNIIDKIGHKILKVLYINYDNTNPILQANLGYFYAYFFDKYEAVDLETFVEIKKRLTEISMSNNSLAKKMLLHGIENTKSSSFLATLLNLFKTDSDYLISRKAEMIFDKLSYKVRKEASKKNKPRRTMKKNDLNVIATIGKETEEMKYLYDDIKEFYSLEKLKKLYKIYFEKIFDLSTNIAISRIKKNDLVKLFAKVLSDKSLFDKFIERAPLNMSDLIQYLLVNTFPQTKADVSKNVSDGIFNQKRSYYYAVDSYDLIDEYLIIPVLFENSYYSNISIFFPQKFRYFLLKYFDLSEKVAIKYYENKEKVEEVFEYTFINNNDFISNFFINYAFIIQNEITYSKNGNKVLKSYYTKMENILNIKEFYSSSTDKDLHNIKKELIINFLKDLKIKNSSQTPTNLIQIYNSFFNGTLEHSFSFDIFIPFIRMRYSYYDKLTIDDDLNLKKEIFNILQSLNTKNWFDVDSIVTNILFRNNGVIDFHRFLDEAYFLGNDGDSKYSRYSEKVTIKYSHCKDAILKPLVKGFFFLLHTLGIIDISYNKPVNNQLQRKSRDYLSIFDGLEVVRLTKFGEYFTGKVKEFKYKSKVKETKIDLDSNRLYIFVSGNDPLKLMQLEKVSEKMREGYYKTGFDIFYKDCKTKDHVLEKIKFFKKNISANPPEIWNDFFTRIQNRVSPLKEINNLTVFKLEEDRELLQLFSKDNILSGYTIKAENFHILVTRRDISKIETRLKELGYFINLK